ncbi:hypothetical protein [Streptomyces tagetis]|uniref:Uncharacterized protein n=1 Tax=Streptomyces tagetis TaxID=2820809 RepID=A0A940XHU9_9ACTN|nr:hypothetical protein [Streptomyces sp. RG38]MBQ0827692.1 hypothetical protein [Streptomyces sp. RG38]
MITRTADKVRALLTLLGPLGAGSQALLLRLIGRFGWQGVLTAGVVAVYAVARYRPAIAWLLTAWCVAAWMHTPREEDEEEPEAPAEKAGEEPFAEAPADALPGLLWALIGEAPGVHIKTLAAHLTAAAPDTPIDRPAVRAALTSRGIPLRGSVRDASGKVNEGVHRDDLECWEQALSGPSLDPHPGARGNPVATPLTSDVADAATAVATPPTAAD